VSEDPRLDELAEALRAGEVVAVPTDTVYGLAARPDSPAATARVFELKGRPDALALPVLVAGLDQALSLAAPPHRPLEALARAFWPGALTVVVRRSRGVELAVGGDAATVGLRCPDDPGVRRLCELVGPLAVTSANRHGEPPCTSPAEVRAAFGAIALLDGGQRAGEPSSVVSIVEGRPVELRRGPIPLDAIEAVLASA